jgi:hypothetical protein
MRSEMWGGCGVRARSRKPLPGGFGHHVRRYYGRCAGCFRWTGTGARRVTPPRAASQETWPEAEKPGPRNLGQSRGGAPRGERADRKARAASADAAPVNCAFRRSASLHLFGRQQHSWRGAESSGAKNASRERNRFSFRPHASGGRGTTGAREASEPWWRGRRRRSFVVGAERTQRRRCLVLLERKRASSMSAHDGNIRATLSPAPPPPPLRGGPPPPLSRWRIR